MMVNGGHPKPKPGPEKPKPVGSDAPKPENTPKK